MAMTNKQSTIGFGTVRRGNSRVGFLLLFWICGLISGGSGGRAEAADAVAPREVKALADIEKQSIRGHVICLAEHMNELYETHLPTNHEHIYGFVTSSGEVYTLLRTRLSEAIFVDTRVRERELVLSVRVLPNSRVIDVVTIKSVKDGIVHDLYYYCFICSIRTVDPAICLCCQEDVEFMEVPLK